MKEVVYVVEQLVDEYYDQWSIILITRNRTLTEGYTDRNQYVVSQHVLEDE